MKSWVKQLAEELVRLEENDSVKASITKAEAKAKARRKDEKNQEDEEDNTQ